MYYYLKNMKYYIYPLRFLTPIHFGNVATGGSLEKVTISYSSDILFSAICNELAHQPTMLMKLKEALESQTLKLSALFPYYKNRSDWELYLPKPIFNVQREIAITDYERTKELATKLKKIKKTAYVRTSVLSNGESKKIDLAALESAEGRQFGTTILTERVNKRHDVSEPYFVGGYRFVANAGLYTVVGFEDEELKLLFDQLIELLGLSGIGGKRSSGYGKFELVREAMEVIISKSSSKDIKALYRLLEASEALNASTYMAISAIAPQKLELDIVRTGYYQLIKRSGFVQSPEVSYAIKRNSCYLLAEGSCFGKPLKGRLITMNIDGIPHAIYNGTMN